MSAARLIAWLRREGGTVAAVRVDGDGDARGVRAEAALAAGALALHVPLPLLVTSRVVASSTVGRRIAAAGIALVSSQSAFAAWLLAERAQAGSRFAPYLDALPATLGLRPAGFGVHTHALLRGTHALALLDAQRASIAADHDVLAAHVPGFAAGVSLAAFTWARLIVTSRVFALDVHGERVDALVPVADLLDHAATPATTWAYDDASAGFALRTTRGCPAGAALTDSYGDKSNARFLVNYGFVLPDNPADEAAILLDHHRAGGERRRQALAHALGELPLAAGGRYLLGADPASGARLLSALRLTAASDDELATLAADLQPGAATVGPLAPARERQVQHRLATLVAAALARFEHPLEHDLAALARPDWPLHVRACLQVRAGEQRILRAWATRARTALAAIAAVAPVPLAPTTRAPTMRASPLRRACG